MSKGIDTLTIILTLLRQTVKHYITRIFLDIPIILCKN